MEAKADAKEAAAPQTAAQINDPQTGKIEETPAPATPAEPKAARTVLDGKTEREIALENQLALANSETKKAQTIAAEWQDKAKQLKDVQTSTPAAGKKKKRGLRLTLLHPDPDEGN